MNPFVPGKRNAIFPCLKLTDNLSALCDDTEAEVVSMTCIATNGGGTSRVEGKCRVRSTQSSASSSTSSSIVTRI